MNIRERDSLLRNVLGVRLNAADAGQGSDPEIEDIFDNVNFTSDQSFVLGTGAFVGERCAVTLKGDSSGYSLNIITGVDTTIHGASYNPTPYASLDTAGQSMHFICVDDNGGVGDVVDWAVDAEAGLGGAGGGLANVVEDTTPQSGGDWDVNGHKIVSVSNGDIDIEPNGTGNVLLGNLEFDADQTVGAGQDDYVLTYDNATGLISLEETAAAGGGGGGGGITRKMCRARPASTLTGVNLTTPTAMAMDSEDYDIGGWHDNVTNNSRMTVPADAGDKVDVHVYARFQNVTANVYTIIHIYKDGALYRWHVHEGPLTQTGFECTLLNDPCTPGTTYYEAYLQVQTDTSVDVLAESCMTIAESVQIISGNSSVTGVSRKGCRARPASNLTGINMTAGYAVPCTSEDFDVTGWHDNATNNTRFTVPAGSGITHVDIQASARIENTSASVWHVINIIKNGTTRIAQNYSYGNTTVQISASALQVAVTEGDYFEISLANTTDTSVDVMAAETYMTIMESIEYIGAVPAEALTLQVSSADANVSATNGVHDEIDISGYSANRDYTLPTSSSLGNRYAVGVSAGNATYSVLVKTGVAGSLIDGVDCSSTEFTRLHITGEMVEFVCIDGSGPKYKAIPHLKAHKAKMTRAAAQTLSSGSPQKIAFDTVVRDVGGIADATTNDRFNIRRAGVYRITADIGLSNLASGKQLQCQIHKNAGGTTFRDLQYSTAAGGSVHANANDELLLAVGDYLEMYGYHDKGSNEDTQTLGYAVPRMTVSEIL